MKNRLLVLSLAVASMTATNLMAAECEKDSQEVWVSGSVDTVNISSEVQVGTIELQLTSVTKNKVIFNERGAIVGQITAIIPSPLPNPPTIILDHDIYFNDGVTIETSGDQAIALGNPLEETDIPVSEVISNFWGTKIFKKATGEINAVGTLNATGQTDGLLHNIFDLSGSLCLKD